VARAVRQGAARFQPQLPDHPTRVSDQELAYGGLKPATRARLDALAGGLDPKAVRKRAINGPVVGTRLVREFQGREYTVTVLNDGFEWEGRRYKSLSAVARAITGTIETRLDGSSLIVRIPMRFQRRGGRKRLIAPDGSVVAANAKPAPDGTLLKALARAWRWQRMLDQGVYSTVSEIGDAENISKSYVSRILRLALLAPDIMEAILAGKTDQAFMLEKLGRPLPASWEEQRRLLDRPRGR
jgi:hypothetical protein